MGWWPALAAVLAGLAQFLQPFMLSAQALRGLLHIAPGMVRSLRSPMPDPDGERVALFFSMLLESRDMRRGVAYPSLPVFPGVYLMLACSPVVGNVAAFALGGAGDHVPSWAEVYPEPEAVLLGAVPLAWAVSVLSLHIAVHLHLWECGILRPRGFGLLLLWGGFLPATTLACAWGYHLITDVSMWLAVTTLLVTATGIGWSTNRRMWETLESFQVLRRPWNVRSESIALRLPRAGSALGGRVWFAALLLLTSIPATLAAYADLYGAGVAAVEWAVALPMTAAVLQVVKDLVLDLKSALARAHRLPDLE
ncbi:hypothetical protein HNP84_006918 [Thermocatellispora tengchongensis]|uniref:Uncharacterized protein n=1 Tax=Thermocatellispora tengchongensis TaxID=1073253 RepID=A0A840PEI5_9ACTN|nr:hypothetical protein [Thermocatellispora tengchongensis]MBB5137166.1 hypothetical protein [Thermocatellispora tengchongensis]